MAVYKYNDSALFVTGSVALSSSLYVSWGSGTGSAATVGIRQNANGTLEFRDNATGSWTEFGSSLDDTTFGDSATDIYTFIGQITASQGALIADDKKLYFGTGQDASIEYDENGTDELRFAGAAATFEQNVTFDNNVTLGVAATDVTTVTGRLTGSQGITSTGKAYFNSDVTLGNAAADVTTATSQLTASEGLLIPDDRFLSFGTGNDASIEYDENGTDELRFAGAAVTFEQDVTFDNDVTLGVATTDITTVTGRLTASQGMLISDDKKLYFGNGQDASIEYDENGSDRLVIDAPSGGVDITGSLYVSGSVYANEYVVDTMTTTITNIEQRGSTKFGDSSDDTHEFSGSLYVADDAKIYFGGNQDAYIEYDENGTDELIISGALGGIDIQMPQAADALTLSYAGGAWMTVSTAGGQSDYTQFNKSVNIIDDTGLYFGTGFDINMQYDEDGTDTLLVDGTGGMTLADDFKLYFGTGLDASIEYDEDGTDELIISGAVGGMSILGPISSTDSVTIGSAAGSLITVDSANMVTVFNESARVADDKKLYFGTNEDASIEYDENGTDELIISGALGGIDIQMPQAADALTLSYAGGAWMTFSTAGGQNNYTQFNQGVNIVDDRGLYFGNDFDVNMKYDEAGTDTLLVDGTGGMTMADDFKLHFGTGLDASIEYDEDGTDELIISGAVGGISILGPLSSTDSVTIGSAAGSLITVDSANMVTVFNESARVADDKKLYFGTNEDAYIEYDENGRNRLIVSGASAGIEISGSAYHTGSYNLSGTFTISGPSTLPMLVMDDSDASAQIGRTHIGYDGTNSDMAIFAHQDKATQTNFALRQRATGQTELNAVAGQSISFKISSANKAILNSSGHLNLLDDIKLIFGTNEDASIEYDENGTDELIISGALGGIDIQMPQAADALTLSYAGAAWMTVSTAGGQNDYTQFNKSVNIIDDTGLYFGTGFDINMQYDEDGTDTLLVDGTGGMTMADDFKLYFGTGLDASIEYDEDGTDELIISGAVGGMSILGPISSTDSVTIGSAAGSLVTVDSANMVTVFNESARVADDKKLYFGTNEDAYIELHKTLP